ncbi:glycerophosphodiester phosphodiesterase [Thermodesulfobacteriota bacterium]
MTLRAILTAAACLVSVSTGCVMDHEVIAHRGASGFAPENTLPAFELAIDRGCDWIECDVRLSADDAVIVMHDAEVDRTTDGTGLVSDLTLAQLKELDAGSWYSDEFAGAEVPTLDETLELVRGSTRLDIELKAGDTRLAGLVLDAVLGANMLDQVILSSFEHEHLMRARELEPAIQVGPLFNVSMAQALGPDGVLEVARGFEAPVVIMSLASFNIEHPLSEYLNTIHEDGRALWLYTIPRELIRYYSTRGVDGLITNYP